MIEIGCHIFIKKGGRTFLDPVKTSLLLEISKSGSLSGAARILNISYQHAWILVNEINKAYSEPLVVKKRGGNNGGGTEITANGQRILSEYHSISKQINKLINQINTEINF